MTGSRWAGPGEWEAEGEGDRWVRGLLKVWKAYEGWLERKKILGEVICEKGEGDRLEDGWVEGGMEGCRSLFFLLREIGGERN